jgi:hypothetical protein
MENNKGCYNCASKKSIYDHDNWKPGQLPVYTCLKGHNDLTNQWWQENGRKKSDEPLTPLNCFHETELAIRLDKMLSAMDRMNDLLDKRKNGDKV